MALKGNFRGRIQLRVTFGGKSRVIKQQGSKSIDLGTWKIKKAGYQKLVLIGLRKKDRTTFGEIVSVEVTGKGKINYVPKGDSMSMHWGRRGPSLTLWHKYPRDVNVQYWYSELKVPKGQDTIGSYFMANGFNVGYFGMQVNSATERRILFSIWSPFKTDNPAEIPEDQRVKLLRKGPETITNDFGNEGSGGQSYKRFSWKPEKTYGFLVKGEPSPGLNDSTDYTAWHNSTEQGW